VHNGARYKKNFPPSLPGGALLSLISILFPRIVYRETTQNFLSIRCTTFVLETSPLEFEHIAISMRKYHATFGA
jgi:hypothetical protein